MIRLTYTSKYVSYLSSDRLLPPAAQSRRQVEPERVTSEVNPHGASRIHAHSGVEGAPQAAKGGAPPLESLAVEGEEDVGAVVAHAVVEAATHHVSGAEGGPASVCCFDRCHHVIVLRGKGREGKNGAGRDGMGYDMM